MTAPLVVVPCARFGHSRLYVQTVDGTSVGHRDNKTGQIFVSDEKYRGVVEHALAAHAPAPVQVLVHPPALTLVQPPSGWVDLANRIPGAAAREQAVILRNEAPVKTVLARLFGVKTPERAWRIGADGEEIVGRQLDFLGPRWKVLHAVPVGTRGSDIDHVVFGPGGVFTINTKHHPGASVWAGGDTVMVNGYRVPYVRNARFEAQRTAKFLTAALGVGVYVTGVIALVGVHGRFTIKSQPVDGIVKIVTNIDLPRRLLSQPLVLSDAQVNHLFMIARRSTTWH